MAQFLPSPLLLPLRHEHRPARFLVFGDIFFLGLHGFENPFKIHHIHDLILTLMQLSGNIIMRQKNGTISLIYPEIVPNQKHII